MKRIWIIRLCMGFALVVCLVAALSVGMWIGTNIGAEFGKAHYHNNFMRHVQAELSELQEIIDRGDIEEAKIKVRRVSELAMTAGDDLRFREVLSSGFD